MIAGQTCRMPEQFDRIYGSVQQVLDQVTLSKVQTSPVWTYVWGQVIAQIFDQVVVPIRLREANRE